MRAADRLRLLFEEQINVMTIAENLKIFNEHNYLEEMEKYNFNTAVIEKDSKYYKFDSGDIVPSPLTEADIIPSDTPLLIAFQKLVEKRRFFIEEGGKLAYIVTRTDLDKIPVRIGFFGLVSILETHLKDLIRKQIPDWEESISENRLVQAKNLYEWKKERKEEIDLVQCLQFGDLGSIFSKKQRFRNLGLDVSREKFTNTMNDLGKLRDALAHSQASLGFSLEEVNEMREFVRTIINHS